MNCGPRAADDAERFGMTIVKEPCAVCTRPPGVVDIPPPPPPQPAAMIAMTKISPESFFTSVS